MQPDRQRRLVEYNALGYSGTNSGGQLVVKNSQFDNNEDGFDTNSQNNDDWPSPQDGACPNGGTSSITHTHSCWVFMHNYVHDNNNPNVPAAGAAAAGPVGTGMSVSGGRDDTIMDNRFVDNGAWGTIFVPYPDTETPPSDVSDPCNGGVGGPGNVCNYDDWGNSLLDNTYTNDGFFGNQTNGDFAEATTTPGHSINCFDGNVDTGGTLTSSPSNLQQTNSDVRADGGDARRQPHVRQSGQLRLAVLRGRLAVPAGSELSPEHRGRHAPAPEPRDDARSVLGRAGEPMVQRPGLPTHKCVPRFVTVNLSVAKRERFTSLSVKIARHKWRRHKARGRHTRVRLDLGAKGHHNVWVRFLERIMVRSHHEAVRFARVYHRC